MKAYYLKYYKGNIDIAKHSVAQALNPDFYLSEVIFDRVSFRKEDEGKVVEYSLGDIRIWITEKGDLELAKDKLVKYAIKFHEINIRRLENNALEQRAWLQPLYSLRDDR